MKIILSNKPAVLNFFTTFTKRATINLQLKENKQLTATRILKQKSNKHEWAYSTKCLLSTFNTVGVIYNFELIIFTKDFSCFASGLNTKPFPDDFLLGVATAAYSVEGAWNEDGKGANIWDNLTHLHSDLIADGRNGDVACDSYHKINEDVALLQNLNVDHYRFSLSWSRILPKGYAHSVNLAGVEYYKKLINALIAKGITPIVTLYHWDLPQGIQDMGGWANEVISDYFEDYARIVFEIFGNKVKHWITFNDPHTICFKGYGTTEFAPALNSTGFGDYLCTYTILKSHARVYRLYNDTFKSKQHGKCQFTISILSINTTSCCFRKSWHCVRSPMDGTL